MKRILTSLATVACLALLTAGCATLGSGPSDEELIQGVVDQYVAAMKAVDLGAAFVLYADDFQGTFGDKETEREFLENSKNQGYLDGMKFDISGLVISIDGAAAQVDGIATETPMANADIALTMEKRDGAWLITESEVVY